MEKYFLQDLSKYLNYLQDLPQTAIIAILVAAFVLVLVLAQYLHSRLGVRSEHTRKFAHVAIGLICVLVPFRFTSHWYFLPSTVGFIGFMLYARRRGQLTALLAVGRQSWGDVLLAVSIYFNAVLAFSYDFERLFYLPMLILAVADPAAYYGGFFFGKNKKSWIGSACFAVVAFGASWGYLSIFAAAPYPHQLWLLAGCAVLGALVEHLSNGGWDNLTVPLAVGALLVGYKALVLG
jgi:phytol kinase